MKSTSTKDREFYAGFWCESSLRIECCSQVVPMSQTMWVSWQGVLMMELDLWGDWQNSLFQGEGGCGCCSRVKRRACGPTRDGLAGWMDVLY